METKKSFRVIMSLRCSAAVMMCAMVAGAGAVGAQDASDKATDVAGFQSAVGRARAALTRDRSKLWSHELDSVQWLGVSEKTMLLTGAPQSVGYGEVGGLWKGPLPTTITPANTSVDWDGRTWAMVVLPVPADTLAAERLLIHEAMHVLQPSVLPGPLYNEGGAGAAALDQAAGRSWMRLEWKALAAALRSSGAQRDTAARDALLFRAVRYSGESPDEVTRERALDVKEGIPEYTAWKLSDSPRSDFIASLDSAPVKLQSFIRGFPYYTGPAYAMLLDDYTNGEWRNSLNADPNLQAQLAKALGASPSTLQPKALEAVATQRAQHYDGPAIFAQEQARWIQRARQLALYRKEFIGGPTVILRPRSVNVSFDPRGQASLDSSGTVMANLAWKSSDGASLNAPAGALINQSWTEIRVALGDTHLQPGVVTRITTVRGNGWIMVLVPGWRIGTSGASRIVTPPAH